MRRSFLWRATYLIAAGAMLLVDQATKAWAARTVRFTGGITLIRGFLDVDYAENRGIAFSQFQSGGELSRWLLASLAACAACGVLIYFLRTSRTDDRMLGACALLLAGIAGNLLDRVRLGHVIDFINVHAGSYYWPTFNVADSCICAGAMLLAYDVYRSGKAHRDVEQKQFGPDVRGSMSQS